MSFPLMHLPRRAAVEVCKAMDIKERILLSFLSKRCKFLLKSSIRKNHLTIGVRFRTPFEIHIGTCQVIIVYEAPHNRRKGDKIGEMPLAIPPTTGDLIELLHDKPIEKTPLDIKMKLVKHFATVFNNPKIDLRMQIHMGRPQDCLRFVKNLQLPLESVDFWPAERVSPEVVTEVINECRMIQKLTICSENFTHHPSLSGVFRIGELIVSGKTDWVKLDDFMECGKIQISSNHKSSASQTNSSPAYLNSFIKKLLDADCKLKSISLTRWGRFDFQKVVDGFGEIQQQGRDQFVDVRGNNGKRIWIWEKRNTWTSELLIRLF